MAVPWVVRRARTILLLAMLAAIPIVYGSFRVGETADNRAAVWLPRHHPGTRDYEWFVHLFGTDEVILVSWDGCTLDDDRLECFARRGESDRGVGDKAAPWAEYVFTGQRAVKELMAPPSRLTRRQVTQRLRGVLIGPDRQTTCAVITLNDRGNQHRGEVLDRIREIAEGQCDVPREALHLTGDIVGARAIDVEGDRAIGRLLPWSIALSFAAACWSLRSWRLSLIVFVLAQFCSYISESCVFYTGGRMNLLVTLVPVLIYVLALSASVHISNYYRDALREVGERRAPWVAVLHGWRPCSLSAVTTALGLGSLIVSHVPAVRSFGMYGSASMVLALGVLVILLPAALARFPDHATESRVVRRKRFFASTLPAFTWRFRGPILVGALAVVVWSVIGVGKIRTSVSPARFLPDSSRSAVDARWFRDRIGPLTQFEIVLGIERHSPLDFGDRMRLVRDLQRTMHSLRPVGGSISAATFAPPLGRVGRMSTLERARRAILDKRLAEHRDVFVKGRYVAESEEREWWRIALRLDRFDELDLDRFRQDVLQRMEPVLARHHVARESVKIVFTGTVPLIYVAQQELLESLSLSFGMALLTITLAMILSMRNFIAGLLVMFPNVFPVAIVFGTMGWSGTLVDVGAMMTASVALGIAVDDTLHFLTWFDRGWRETGNRRLALREAFTRSAPAMLQTTLIAGLGIAVFSFADFQPVARFGLLMASLLLGAIVGDLVLLPAMLASPLGKWFARRDRLQRAATATPDR